MACKRDPMLRDRDETETFDFQSETRSRPTPSPVSTRPRRDRDVWKLRLETETSRPRDYIPERHHSLMSDACESPTSTKFPALQADRGRHLPVFRYIAAVDFIQQPVQTGSARYLMLKFPYSSHRKLNPSCRRSPDGATLCCKFDEVRVNRGVHNEIALKFAKDHAD